MKVVGIRFRQAGKIYYFNAKNIEFEYKDLAVVETSNGIEIAEVALTDVDLEKNQPKEKLSEIIRKATKDDIYYYKKNEKEAKEAIGLCQQKACEHGLSMKIIDAKYTFDRSKITFYFKSENRVDFRGLVKDLAAIYKNRIELRQIGVRDHAKMIEHFGPCGQRCCCGRFLNDFKPLSIKMAKDQNITLDPAKISGICGRLMCCLSYEEECYKCAKKIMPKEGQKVKTADGYGMVLENDYVKESSRVRVKLTGTDEEIEESYLLKEMEY
ncbi:stage 0 sporulation family protein [Anaerococcus tetradius]|uniref:PSP1 protein n=1 Tax=Anaerococcus tetradius TaxID=33036 RepID=A0A133KHC1_9FIRM|nr:stage 0 sporulation family protein [Anaerococcus tetradius]KWZ78962.1 PSP1 protein [Anaerococcus tetradius]